MNFVLAHTKLIEGVLLVILMAIFAAAINGCAPHNPHQKHIMACIEPPCVKDNTYFECMDRQDACLEDYLNNN